MAGRQLERSNIQARQIEENVNQVDSGNTINSVHDSRCPRTKGICRNCGGEWPHTKAHDSQSHLPATQDQRQGRNNIRRINTSESEQQSSGSESSNSEYCYAVKRVSNKTPLAKLKINNHKVPFTVDTGSTINIMERNTFKALGDINLKKTSIKAYPTNSAEPLKLKENFKH